MSETKMFKVRMINGSLGDETDAGLYFQHWNKVLHNTIGIKRGVYYTASALKQLPGLSKTTLAKIDSAKVGTKIRVCRISSTSSMYFIRVSDEELAKTANISSLKDELARVEEEINRAIPQTLLRRRRELQRMIKDCEK